MNFEEHQQVWRNMKWKPTPAKELRAMMYNRSTPYFRPRKKEVRRFIIWLTCLLAAGALCYHFSDVFTGTVVIWLTMGAVNRFMGLQYVKLMPQYDLEQSFREFVHRSKRTMAFTVAIYGVLFVAAVVAILNMHLSALATAGGLVAFVCAFAAATWSTAKKWWHSVSDASHTYNNTDRSDHENN